MHRRCSRKLGQIHPLLFFVNVLVYYKIYMFAYKLKILYNHHKFVETQKLEFMTILQPGI